MYFCHPWNTSENFVQWKFLFRWLFFGTGRDGTDTHGRTDIWTDRLFSENIILDKMLSPNTTLMFQSWNFKTLKYSWGLIKCKMPNPNTKLILQFVSSCKYRIWHKYFLVDITIHEGINNILETLTYLPILQGENVIQYILAVRESEREKKTAFFWASKDSLEKLNKKVMCF